MDLRALAGRHVYPRRLIFAALVLPVVLLGALVALDFWVFVPALQSPAAHLAMFVVGAAGVVAFSVAILARSRSCTPPRSPSAGASRA